MTTTVVPERSKSPIHYRLYLLMQFRHRANYFRLTRKELESLLTELQQAQDEAN